ncbi:MAG TPA: glycosyltransferase family 4 protein [Polyangia bacterium]|nr:glycosyltransferase family 4 protein [Polyangia bacterium]
MTPRRVAHVLRKYDPSEWGGTETHVAAITARQPALGWLPEVHAPAGPLPLDGQVRGGASLRRFNAFVPFLGPAERRRALVANAGNIASFDEPMRLVRDRGLALAHLHTAGRLGGGVRFAMRLTGRPYVVSVHGPLLAQREWLAEDVRARHERLVDVGQPIGALFGARHVYRDAARIITFNEEERRALEPSAGARVLRMDHGVDVARLAAGDARRALARWPLLARGPLLVVVGRLCAQKNQVLAVRAFAAGAPPDAQLALAGAATDLAARDEILAEARRLGVGERVHVLGNLDVEREVPDLFAAATLVLVPSRHEAFGLVALEAWAAGRPTLMAARSGLAELAAAAGPDALTVSSLEPDEWARALDAALGDASKRAACAAAGRALVRARFDWDRVTARLTALYDEVLDERAEERAA